MMVEDAVFPPFSEKQAITRFHRPSDKGRDALHHQHSEMHEPDICCHTLKHGVWHESLYRSSREGVAWVWSLIRPDLALPALPVLQITRPTFLLLSLLAGIVLLDGVSESGC